MAPFDPDSDLSADIAYQLLANGFVTLFWRPEVLERVVGWLSDRGYQVVEVDASRWITEQDMHRDLAVALQFPDYYGHNLDALHDCMRDVVMYEYGWSAEATGLALVFTGYHGFAQRCPHAAQAVLDIVADSGRSAALFGRRLLCLVQSDDPDIEFAPVGATPVEWNASDWADAERSDRP
jgi:acetolactate synthase regulatory subunit